MKNQSTSTSTGPSPSKYAKRYDQAFRREAVRLLVQSGRPPKQVAEELGVSAYSLGRWKKSELAQAGEVTGANGQKVSAPELEQELRAARKEIEYLKRQREILKKP